MAARRNSLADPQHIGSVSLHIGSVSLRGRDTPSLDFVPRRTTSPLPRPWLPAKSHACGERSAKTKPSLPPNRVSHCERGAFHGPAFCVPRYLLGNSPKDTSDDAYEHRQQRCHHGGRMQRSQLKTDLEI